MKKIIHVVLFILFSVGCVYITLHYQSNNEPKQDVIEKLYIEKARAVREKREIQLRKQEVDKNLLLIEKSITELDKKILQEANSWLNASFQ